MQISQDELKELYQHDVNNEYLKYEGEKLRIIPRQVLKRPNANNLEWHRKHVFRG